MLHGTTPTARRNTCPHRERLTLRAFLVAYFTGDLNTLPPPRSEREVARLLGLTKSTVHRLRDRAHRLLHGADEEPTADRCDRLERNARRRRRKPRPLDD